mmetsp:Transcript_34528/g.75493  ORF Transcript_34528/g.75493 Transcript_34528/m.75493 type:complete len:221 (-) Transcript_34528:706-1368(-)
MPRFEAPERTCLVLKKRKHVPRMVHAANLMLEANYQRPVRSADVLEPELAVHQRLLQIIALVGVGVVVQDEPPAFRRVEALRKVHYVQRHVPPGVLLRAVLVLAERQQRRRPHRHVAPRLAREHAALAALRAVVGARPQHLGVEGLDVRPRSSRAPHLDARDPGVHLGAGDRIGAPHHELVAPRAGDFEARGEVLFAGDELPECESSSGQARRHRCQSAQ